MCIQDGLKSINIWLSLDNEIYAAPFQFSMESPIGLHPTLLVILLYLNVSLLRFTPSLCVCSALTILLVDNLVIGIIMNASGTTSLFSYIYPITSTSMPFFQKWSCCPSVANIGLANNEIQSYKLPVLSGVRNFQFTIVTSKKTNLLYNKSGKAGPATIWIDNSDPTRATRRSSFMN